MKVDILTNKYGNKFVVIDNILFRSKKEADRYIELKLLKKQKKISDLAVHPRFLLYAGIKYEADFTYLEEDPLTGKKTKIVEDVKGVKTQVYKLKKKLFLEIYKDVVFREI